MIYKIISWLNDNFPYLLFWTCVLQGIIGFFSTFLFPPLAIGMIFIGLATIGIGKLVSVTLKKTHDAMSKNN